MVKVIKIKENYPEVMDYEAEKFRDDLTDFVEVSTEDLVLDLSGVDLLCSIAVSAIIMGYKLRKDQGKKLSVVNACDRNRKLFEMLNIEEIITD